MRPNSAAVIERSSNFTGKSTDMRIDDTALQHIMGLLTDLYSDQALAVIREYSTNAADSHAAAGNDAPVLVTLPSAFKRSFVVQDFGVGLSADDLDSIYSKYGASTKRETDEQVGMLGLGCKSALTYCDSFVLVARKNGFESQVIIARKENGVGAIEFVTADVPTDKPNGVTVTVPVSDVHEFNRKAQEFFRFWTPGSVLVDGKEPVLSDLDYITVSDDLFVFVSSNYYSTKDYVVMGNVAYPVDYSKLDAGFSRSLSSSVSFVKHVPIGSVNFTPNREELQYTARTVATIRAAATEASRGLAVKLQESVDKATTAIEALTAAFEQYRFISPNTYYHSVPKGTFKWNGADIPTRVVIPAGSVSFRPSYSYPSYEASVNELGMDPYAHRGEKFLVVHGFDQPKLTPYRKRKLDAYIDTLNVRFQQVVLVPNDFKTEWLDATYADWSDVNAIKLSGNRNTAVKYDVYTSDGTAWPSRTAKTIEELDDIDVVYYSPGDVRKAAQASYRRSYDRAPRAAIAYDKTITLVSLSRNSWAKFEREHEGECVHIDAWIEQEAAAKTAGFTDAERILASLPRSTVQRLQAFEADEVLDPELAKLVEKSADYEQIQTEINELNLLSNLSIWANGSSVTLEPAGDNALDEYPLLGYTDSTEMALEYVNAVHAYRA